MIRREDYKAVKRMNREEMSNYLNRIYQRGVEAGKNSVAANLVKPKPEEEKGEEHEQNAKAVERHSPKEYCQAL